MRSESDTEANCRSEFTRCGWTKEQGFEVRGQFSGVQSIDSPLETASKNGSGNKGRVDLTIYHPDRLDEFVVLVECKADSKKHRSKSDDRAISFAVDGVIHYARYVAHNHNVVAIAYSGNPDGDIKISVFYIGKGTTTLIPLKDESGDTIEEILSFEDYSRLIEYNKSEADIKLIERRKIGDVAAQITEIHSKNRSLLENDFLSILSGTSLALEDDIFKDKFSSYKNRSLANVWLQAIENVVEKLGVDKDLLIEYRRIADSNRLIGLSSTSGNGVLYEVIHLLNGTMPVWRRKHDSCYDAYSIFYTKGIKNHIEARKKGGIVLTPTPVARIMAKLLELKADSRIIDICAGSGALLYAALTEMLNKTSSYEEKQRIKRELFRGIEFRAMMYGSIVWGMNLRDCNASNLHLGDCFKKESMIKEFAPTHGIINPPYGTKEHSELDFIYFLLYHIQPGGRVCSISPQSCVSDNYDFRKEMMKRHTLECVIMLSDRTFDSVDTSPCIMLWTAGVPHKKSNRKTWLADWRELDIKSEDWEYKEDDWIDFARNRECKPRVSLLQQVDHEDEWLYSSFKETDYSLIGPSNIKEAYKELVISCIRRI